MRLIFSLIFVNIMIMFPSITSSHHSFSAEFDVGRYVELTGTVTHLEWTNPHAWIHIETTDENGNKQKWAIEMLGINNLVRSGITPQTIKMGDTLSITGYGARNGTNTANAASVTRTDSKEILWSNARERNK